MWLRLALPNATTSAKIETLSATNKEPGTSKRTTGQRDMYF